MINRMSQLIAATLLSGVALAQDQGVSLQLFEPLDQPSGAEESVSRPTTVTTAGGAPRFTLVGTSRIAGQQKVWLRSQNGESVVIALQGDSRSQIPGHSGFFVEEVIGRQVVIRHPADNLCSESVELGVTCPASDVSRLLLTTAAPMQRQTPSANPAAAAQSQDEQAGSGEERLPDNPFAAALRAARERGEQDDAAARAEAQRFRPRRIDPADVPPGARLVRTPFGDRIVRDQ
jgi:hypothetical protein